MWYGDDVNKIYFVYKERKYIFASELKEYYLPKNIVRDRAGVARWAHNPKVGSSNLPPATRKTPPKAKASGGFIFR
jgi:hypothetical protein